MKEYICHNGVKGAISFLDEIAKVKEAIANGWEYFYRVGENNISILVVKEQ